MKELVVLPSCRLTSLSTISASNCQGEPKLTAFYTTKLALFFVTIVTFIPHWGSARDSGRRGRGKILGLVKCHLVVNIVRLEVECLFESFNGLMAILALKVSGAKAGVSLGPLWLQIDALFSIRDGRAVIVEFQPTRTAVAEEDMIGCETQRWSGGFVA